MDSTSPRARVDPSHSGGPVRVSFIHTKLCRSKIDLEELYNLRNAEDELCGLRVAQDKLLRVHNSARWNG